MKKILIFKLFIASMLFAIVSCSDKDELTSTGSHIHVETGFGEDTFSIIKINESEVFADLSSGVVSRRWEFPGGDTTDVTTSTEPKVRVTFKQPGNFQVKLSLNFGSNPIDLRDGPNATVKSSTQVERIINVRVVEEINASTVQAFIVKDDGTLGDELTLENNAKNAVAAGQKIRFLQKEVIGLPSDFAWTLTGANDDSDVNSNQNGEIEVFYRQLGTYDLQLVASRDFPVDSDTLNLTDFIEVVQSTKPVVISEIVRDDAQLNVIRLAFDRLISLDGSVDASDFTITASQTFNQRETGFRDLKVELPFTVTAAAVSDSIPYELLLTLDDSLYNTDTVIVSHGGSTSIVAVDNSSSSTESFSNVRLIWNRVNLAAAYGGFEEDPVLGVGWQQADINGTNEGAGPGIVQITSKVVHSGKNSLFMKAERLEDNTSGQKWAEAITDADVESPNFADAWNVINLVEGQRYDVSYWAYVEQTDIDSWPNSPRDEIAGYFWFQNTKFLIHEYTKDPFPTNPEYPIQEWVQVRNTKYRANETQTRRAYFRVIGSISTYIDDLEVYVVEERPFKSEFLN